ncbi:M50 family metallopeptidase [Inediibacterium massiliense]|uniref:M50 family metallopeptidase n=1 Tax=Inediibacterium massiliense TaxID=1658111 RepID=UPI0006B5C736|nr:M50 family metallopeptidase [Inediibacterium massiliense]
MRIVKILGIDIEMNPLLSIVFLIFFLLGYIKNLIISLFIVLLHEGAHMIAAKKFGYQLSSIELFPFGGVAKVVGEVAIHPSHEIFIAAAGPLFNLVMALLGYELYNAGMYTHELFVFFILSNFIIGIFNLIPILPLDGGRIIRAYCAYFIGIKKATKLVAILSKSISVILFMIGILLYRSNPFHIYLSCLAIFLYIAACKEYKMAAFIFMKEISLKKQHLLQRGMLHTKHLTALKNTSIQEVLNQFIPRKYYMIIVMDEKCNMMGMLTENDLFEGMIKYGVNTTLEKLLINK